MTATKTRTTKGKTTKAPTKDKAAKAATTEDNGPSKSELRAERDADLTLQMLELKDNGESWAEIASTLSVTSGKAQFLWMKHCVAEGEVPAIEFEDEDELVAGILEAREASDQHSSWGWIAARTGVSEGKVKALAEEAGMEVRGANIAVKRAELNGKGEKADAKTAKQATRKASAKADKNPASKAAAAKRRARRAKGGDTDPS